MCWNLLNFVSVMYACKFFFFFCAKMTIIDAVNFFCLSHLFSQEASFLLVSLSIYKQNYKRFLKKNFFFFFTSRLYKIFCFFKKTLLRLLRWFIIQFARKGLFRFFLSLHCLFLLLPVWNFFWCLCPHVEFLRMMLIFFFYLIFGFSYFFSCFYSFKINFYSRYLLANKNN